MEDTSFALDVFDASAFWNIFIACCSFFDGGWCFELPVCMVFFIFLIANLYRDEFSRSLLSLIVVLALSDISVDHLHAVTRLEAAGGQSMIQGFRHYEHLSRRGLLRKGRMSWVVRSHEDLPRVIWCQVWARWESRGWGSKRRLNKVSWLGYH